MKVVKDIYKQLHLKEPVEKFNSSSFRSNLYYEVCLKETLEDPYEDLARFAVKSLSGVPESEDDCWVRQHNVSPGKRKLKSVQFSSKWCLVGW